MVKETLTKEMLQAGADLVRRLDEAHLEVNAALWLYVPDANLWRLVIASPAVKDEGPKRVYQKIQSVLSQAPDDAYKVTLSDISRPFRAFSKRFVRNGAKPGIHS